MVTHGLHTSTSRSMYSAHKIHALVHMTTCYSHFHYTYFFFDIFLMAQLFKTAQLFLVQSPSCSTSNRAIYGKSCIPVPSNVSLIFWRSSMYPHESKCRFCGEPCDNCHLNTHFAGMGKDTEMGREASTRIDLNHPYNRIKIKD